MLQIRKTKPGDEQGIAEVHVSAWKTTYAGLIPESFLETLSVQKQAAMWARAIKQMNEREGQKVVFVCEDPSGKIHGFVSGGDEREAESGYDSELYSIYLVKDQQGKGMGRRLTRELAQWLSQSGYKKMRLWVLQNNPSCRFYESLGGQLLPHSKNIELGGKTFLEVSYGWDDLTALLKS